MWRLILVGLLTSCGVWTLVLGAPSGGPARLGSGAWVRGGVGATARVAWRWLHAVALLLGRSAVLRGLRERNRRQELARACGEGVPELLDMVALGLSAGLSFDASLELYCARGGNGLARVMEDALRGWQMGLGSRGEMLEEAARRLGSAPLRRLAFSVSEALAFGSPLSGVLERQAQLVREERRSEVVRRMEEAPVRMLLPLGTLVVPAMLLAVVGPLMAGAFAP